MSNSIREFDETEVGLFLSLWHRQFPIFRWLLALENLSIVLQELTQYIEWADDGRHETSF